MSTAFVLLNFCVFLLFFGFLSLWAGIKWLFWCNLLCKYSGEDSVLFSYLSPSLSFDLRWTKVLKYFTISHGREYHIMMITAKNLNTKYNMNAHLSLLTQLLLTSNQKFKKIVTILCRKTRKVQIIRRFSGIFSTNDSSTNRIEIRTKS